MTMHNLSITLIKTQQKNQYFSWSVGEAVEKIFRMHLSRPNLKFKSQVL